MTESVQANQACILSISSTLGVVANAAFNQQRLIDPAPLCTQIPLRRLLPAPTGSSGGQRGTLTIEPAEEEESSASKSSSDGAKEKKEKKKLKKKTEENSKENGD